MTFDQLPADAQFLSTPARRSIVGTSPSAEIYFEHRSSPEWIVYSGNQYYTAHTLMQEYGYVPITREEAARLTEAYPSYLRVGTGL